MYLHKPNISKDDKIDYVFTELSKYEEPKETFKFALENYDFSRDKTMIRYILRFIENIALNEKGYIEDDNKKVHIEHIMPQNPKTFPEWNVTEEEHEELLWSLGNLTLWLGTNNSALKNADFNTKKNIYKDSDVAFTRNLNLFQEWNKEKINTRRDNIVNVFLNKIK